MNKEILIKYCENSTDVLDKYLEWREDQIFRDNKFDKISSNLLLLEAYCTFNRGQEISNINRDLEYNNLIPIGDKKNRERNYYAALEDLNKFVEDHSIYENSQRILEKASKEIIEKESDYSEKIAKEMTKSFDTRRSLISDHQRRWIFYQKLWGE